MAQSKKDNRKTLGNFQKVDEGDNVKMLKGYFEEVINPNEDPTVQMTYKHINSGLMAFNQAGQSPQECRTKYIFMLRMAEALMESEFGFNFREFRRLLREDAHEEGEDLSEEEIASEELKKVGELLQMRKRKFNVALRLNKPPNREDKPEEDDENEESDDQENQ